MSLKVHLVSFIREKLSKRQVLSAAGLSQWPDGTPVRVVGLVLVRQRPGTASGICFITIEDETGTANLVAFQNLFNKYRKEILRSTLLMVEGTLQREGEVTHVIIQRCYDMSSLLLEPGSPEDKTPPLLTLSRADEKEGDILSPQQKKKALSKLVQGELFPSRDFK
ncbi:OB-fold nucleic acid binding domain-containing protein [Foetidibacter luteolus]|uniref:OB-fold nucleic acid binding domain-containing protein n=1 Tax=Foetidibacter luteolus TaxID=2608880 RepID=UPI001F2A6DDF|nr:OB-fold nucleic acid binding domain-containing protein [Foetidibacter luteolus]